MTPSFPTLRRGAALLALLIFTACSPRLDWRDVRGEGAPFMVTLPGKASSFSRPIRLGEIPVTMTMTAAEVDDVTYAVGTAELSDAAQTVQALAAMQTAMLRNVGAAPRQERTVTAAGMSFREVEAVGPPGSNTQGQPRLLLARFGAKDKRVYQLVILGREPAVSREAADTFFSSFKTL
ncbi:hypothetical protein SAMN06265795_101333 [Noviherbaspirillum humi]|uniref:Transmembrane protein n=1 Tax=Noviherbaspirillum humi TaxID=1688639 RepID=A0A239C9P5_9BURK|nr:hypothetical protein [Noviherbaspirillum humi]SNS16820.1 hypothetical protein SAMN06265795_101333 [Noviherbaspirillum humi]